MELRCVIKWDLVQVDVHCGLTGAQQMLKNELKEKVVLTMKQLKLILPLTDDDILLQC